MFNFSTPVDDRADDHFYYATVEVSEGDDLVILKTEDGESEVETRMTVQEALAMITSLTEAITVALSNN
jgi:hypothetical protein